MPPARRALGMNPNLRRKADVQMRVTSSSILMALARVLQGALDSMCQLQVDNSGADRANVPDSQTQTETSMTISTQSSDRGRRMVCSSASITLPFRYTRKL